MTDPTPSTRYAAPFVIGVGCPDELWLLVGMAVEELGVELRPVELGMLETAVRDVAPVAVLVEEHVLAFDRPHFQALADGAQAPLIEIASDGFDPAELRAKLGPAVVAWRARRHRVRSGTRRRVRSSSGLRLLGKKTG